MSKVKQRIFTEDEKQRIIEDYQNPVFQVLEIRENYHINGRQLKEILDEYGIPNRQPASAKPKNKLSPPLKMPFELVRDAAKRRIMQKRNFVVIAARI